MRMITRQNEIYSILGISWGEQSSPAPRTRQEEIFDIVSFPAVSRRTSPNDVGATLAVARPQGSPTGEPWTPQPAAPTAPLSGEPNTSSGAYAPPSPQGEGRSAEQVQQELADSRKQLAQLGACVTGENAEPNLSGNRPCDQSQRRYYGWLWRRSDMEEQWTRRNF